MRRIGLGIVSLALALAVGLAYSMPNAYAARKKVDCNAVMKELSSGKKVKEVATDLKISTSSVYRCRRREKMEAKHEAKTSEHEAKATNEGAMTHHMHMHRHHHRAAPAATATP